jgi:antitoxin (DNA-binding transcriptional repressor) of toxin-antitoxin stability system
MWYHVDIMSVQMGVRELRDSLTIALRRVRAGETIEVTHHHNLIAVISPPPADRIESLLASGHARVGKPLEKHLRRFQATGELTASQALQDDRG